jgi:hypothetical protein
LDQVPLILWTGIGISNPWSQGGTKEAVKSVELRKKVLSLSLSPLGTQSIHEMHLFWLENIEGVIPIIWLHGQLVLKDKQMGKPSDYDLILLYVSHPHKPLSIYNKV